ncbi:MAG: FAD-binding protein, partial [Deltaproteobacteria bacterium]|nr:FAD-binding protein [Deltaproteobacteria bacterium]
MTEEAGLDEKIKKALIKIAGEDNVTDALMDLVSYSYDFSQYRSRPQGAVWPSDTEQVSAILRLASREKIPIVPRGAGTGATGLAVPQTGGIVMDLLRMNRILKISIEDRLAVVQPGVVYADLQNALSPHGFFFPPDPASGKVATLGGNVATNAGGLKGAKYGTTKDYVLALEVVLPDGRVMRTGSNCMKSVSGYDMTKLFVGSEGTLGVMTEITFKIDPLPTATTTAVGSFGKLEQAGRAVSEIMHSGIIPSVCELLDRNIIGLLIEQAGLDLPRAEAMILVETDGRTKTETEFQMDEVMEVFKRNGALEIKKAASAEEAEGLWQARRSMGGILVGLRPNFLVEDVTVPISRLTELIRGIEGISEKYGVEIINFGHAGDGNLHPHLMYDGANPEEVEKVEKASAELFAMACDLGGTLSGEHGIGLAKASFMGLEHDPVAMDMMR